MASRPQAQTSAKAWTRTANTPLRAGALFLAGTLFCYARVQSVLRLREDIADG